MEAPKTQEQMPAISSCDGSTRLATTIEHSIDSNPVSPSVQKRTGNSNVNSNDDVEPKASIHERVFELKTSIGSKPSRQPRGLSQSYHSPTKRQNSSNVVNRRRLQLASMPLINKDKSEEDAPSKIKESFERVVNSHESVPDGDLANVNSSEVPASTRTRKVTVEDMKKDLLRDRQRGIECAQNSEPVEAEVLKIQSRTQKPRRHMPEQVSKLIAKKVANVFGNAD